MPGVSSVSADSDSADGALELATNILSQFTAVNMHDREETLNEQGCDQQPDELPKLSVVLPAIDNEDDYGFLPGYSEVDEILERVEDSYPTTYCVRLNSGDILNLSASYIRTIQNGRDALLEFNNTMGRRTHRRTIQSRLDGFVNSTALTFSSDEDEPRRKRKSSRTRIAIAPRRSLRDDSSSDDVFNDMSIPTRRSSRLVATTAFQSSDESSESESLESSSSGQRWRRTRRRPGRAKENQKLARPGIRSSNRVRSSRSMAERLEDDISEVEDALTGTKYSAAKETFQKLSKDNPFRARHQQICHTCLSSDDTKGPLVVCQGCTTSYHHKCLGPRGQREHLVTKVGENDFVLQCRRCLGSANSKDALAPHLGACSQCHQMGPLSKPLRSRMTPREEQLQREENGGSDPIIHVQIPLYNIDNVMFRCVSCNRAWHMSHLPPRGRNSSRGPETLDSEEDESRDEEHDHDHNHDHDHDRGDEASQRFKEYSRRFTCEDCATMPGDIESLVAWRPVNIDKFIPGYTSDMMEENMKEYLVKWRKQSYFRTSWMPGPWVWGVIPSPMRHAFNRSPRALKPIMSKEDAIPEENLRVDIIFDLQYSNVVSNRNYEIDMARSKEVSRIYVKYKGLTYEEAVWETIPTPQETERWQDYQTAYEDWVAGKYVHVPKSNTLKKHLTIARSRDFATQLVKQAQPSILTGGQIMEYQKDGLNWLYYMWYKEQNAILADEMGLGKTIQIIALFATLVQDHKCWPFLVVVPNSTCPNWRREIKTWAPSLRVVTYYGSSAARKIAHDYEMFPDGATDLRCHIVVTSYETMIDDKARRLFSRIPWAGLVVDEGQRLKNDKNQLYEALTRIHFPFKVLLTGTPLQNNVRELFNILQFCDQSKNAEALEEQYGQDLTKEALTEIHDMIRPFFLRRTKAQVLTFLPPMAQIILPVTMSVVQKKLYKSILGRNPQLIKAIFKRDPGSSLKQTERHNLNNILMQLRKCLCHPFVYSKAIEERTTNATLLHRNLVEASSKLQLLELLLPKLQERGHRVLIFSQFLDNLDIVEDFLDGLGLLHRRLDGSLSSLQKQKQIDEFNAPNSPYFAFLLSTRSGGVGINLATADTVIIMDPDFNPHQDIQALSRAHRIGQQKKVLVFQLVTRGSAEEKIMQMGKKKMALDQVLIEHMDAEDDTEVDLEAILRHGADALFDDDTTNDIHYDNESIEKLLDRSQMENTKIGNDGSAESQFSFARVWVNDSLSNQLGNSETPTPNSTVWEKILKERERVAAEEAKANAQTLGRGKRKRQTVDYALQNSNVESILKSSPQKAATASDKGDSDTEFQFFGVESDTEDVDTDADFGGESQKSGTVTAKVRPYKRAKVPDVDLGLDGTSTRPLRRCVACDQNHSPGHCPLKLAGPEHCGLCGIAHYGRARTCPHLNSESQVALMLGSLKESPEQRALVEEATKYLRGIRGDLVRRKKLKENKDAPGSSRNSTRALPSGNQTPATHPRPSAYLVPPQPLQANPNPGAYPIYYSRLPYPDTRPPPPQPQTSSPYMFTPGPHYHPSPAYPPNPNQRGPPRK
ncbi:hypothetical protein FQN53_009364 [Emmonsiellopsis sp. PD_33]|nr:hypothetical protein FQN53_009364 [Emmonsiellopsis sp. PD_33]